MEHERGSRKVVRFDVLPEELRAKLMEGVMRSVPTKCPVPNIGLCWIWQSAFFNDGYARTSWKGVHYRAHRLSYMNFVGPIPKGRLIRHLCHTRNCVKPNHLKPGTYKDNFKDKIDFRGLQHPNASLTEQDVREIFERAWNGENVQALADYYNVTRKTIYNIKNGKTWTNIHED